MNTWFTVKVKYTKQLENGAFKRVSEPYLLAAMTFTDAEARVYDELGAIIRGEFTVTNIARTDFHDIFHYEDSDTWYKCKITYFGASEDSEKPKKVSQNFLLSAHSVANAYERMQESLSTLMVDFLIPSIIVSPIVDVFPYNEELDKEISRKPVAQSEGTENDHCAEFAARLHRREYRNEITREEEQEAKTLGLVVVFGASDDLTEFCGAISDEQGYGELYFDKQGDFHPEDVLSASEKNNLNVIYTRHCPFGASTDIPHYKFEIMEAGEVYGVGIVFRASDLK